MNINVNFQDFKGALKRLDKIKNNTTLPILDNIYVVTEAEQVILVKKNSNTTLKTYLNGNTLEHGEIIIPESTTKLINNIKKTNGYELTIRDEYMQIGSKKINFKKLPIKNYLSIDTFTYIRKFEVTEKELSRLLEVYYCTAKDETRPILKGINIRNNDFVALDGYRLSKRHSFEFRSDLNVTISNDTAKLLIDLIDKKSNYKVTIYLDDTGKNIRFAFKDYDIVGKLLDGEYIRYEQIIPNTKDSTTVINIADDEIMDKIQLINKLQSNKILTKFDITAITINITAKDTENIIDDVIVGTVYGKALEIYFNNKYVAEALKFYDGKFDMYFINSVSPAIITNDTENLELLLPVRNI